MDAPTKLQIEADRVFSVISSLPYQDTVGSWLKEIRESSVREMSDEDDPIKNAKARGKYLAVSEILDRIDAVLQRREAESKRRAKQLQEGTTK